MCVLYSVFFVEKGIMQDIFFIGELKKLSHLPSGSPSFVPQDVPPTTMTLPLELKTEPERRRWGKESWCRWASELTCVFPK